MDAFIPFTRHISTAKTSFHPVTVYPTNSQPHRSHLQQQPAVALTSCLIVTGGTSRRGGLLEGARVARRNPADEDQGDQRAEVADEDEEPKVV
jgi:hypothetical protein